MDDVRKYIAAAIQSKVTDWPNHGPDETFDEGWDAGKYAAVSVVMNDPLPDLEQEIAKGRHAQAALRLVIMRHHEGPYDYATCDVCAAAVAGLGS